MQDLETRALSTTPHPPSLWKRYVDDTLTIIKRDHKDTFLDHLNSIDANIKFTSEDPKEDGSISFLDILINPRKKMVNSTPLYIESPPMLTCIYIGIAIITYLQNTV